MFSRISNGLFTGAASAGFTFCWCKLGEKGYLTKNMGYLTPADKATKVAAGIGFFSGIAAKGLSNRMKILSSSMGVLTLFALQNSIRSINKH